MVKHAVKVLEETSKVLNTVDRREAGKAPQCASMAGKDIPRARWEASNANADRIAERAETALAAARTTSASVAREETSGTTMEENPGTAREAGESADVRITSPSTAREEMTPDKPAKSVLVIQWQAAQEARETAATRTT